jgi:hypothetical protein
MAVAPLACDGELLPFELTRLRSVYLMEAQSDSRYSALSPGARHVLKHRIAFMLKSGETYASERTIQRHIPAFDHNGRPSMTGYISRPTLRRYDRELESAGFLTSWRTNGTVRNGLPTPPIHVKRLDRTLWRKAWARFKAWREQMLGMLRGTFSQVKAKSSRGKRVVASRQQSFSLIPAHADNCALASRVNRLRRQRDFERERRRIFDECWEADDFRPLNALLAANAANVGKVFVAASSP